MPPILKIAKNIIIGHLLSSFKRAPETEIKLMPVPVKGIPCLLQKTCMYVYATASLCVRNAYMRVPQLVCIRIPNVLQRQKSCTNVKN
jgi:hypothetical protein